MEYIVERDKIYVENERGNVIAEVTFPQTGSGVQTIDHTYVDSSLRGQGDAGELVKRAVETIKANGNEVRATCSYAIKWLSENKESNI